MDFNHLNNVVRTSNTIHSYFRFVLFLPFFLFFFFCPVLGIQNVFENMLQSNLRIVT